MGIILTPNTMLCTQCHTQYYEPGPHHGSHTHIQPTCQCGGSFAPILTLAARNIRSNILNCALSIAQARNPIAVQDWGHVMTELTHALDVIEDDHIWDTP